jgi:hypothetical protein
LKERQMAKKSQSRRGQDITPADIAKALDHISAWVRSVRSAVLKMDPKASIKAKMPGGTAAAAPGFILDGCAPPPPAKKRSKKK